MLLITPPLLEFGRHPGHRHTCRRWRVLLSAARVATLSAALWATGSAWAQGPAAAPSAPGRSALTVQLVTPQRANWPQQISANGSIAAWQEVVISAEVSGLRLVEVAAQVGDRVRRGQLLARLSTEMLQADMAQTRAAVNEAQALLAEASANADRARELKPSGVFSVQQTTQILTAEQTAKARVESLLARLQADQLRQTQARIVAPDDGVISARTALEGALAQPGQELFRLIRRGRLEWRAEAASAELARIQPGMAASVITPSGRSVAAKVRLVAPTVDAQSRNGVVFVDVQPDAELRPGMFARGQIVLGQSPSLSLPQSAVQLKDGFSYVMRVGADQRVILAKVSVGRRSGERVEIIDGLAADAAVVASGSAFLADGDRVKVVAGSVSASVSAPVGASLSPSPAAAAASSPR